MHTTSSLLLFIFWYLLVGANLPWSLVPPTQLIISGSTLPDTVFLCILNPTQLVIKTNHHNYVIGLAIHNITL